MYVQFTNQENLASLTINCDEYGFRLNLVLHSYQITGQV